MDTNSKNQENDDHYHMYGIRKKTYLEKYCIQHFPYRGRRRYSSSITQSFDGGIIISNDVFGLTIKQFEESYRKCLEKRKTQEQWIINLRYPDKSSNAYLEYLQNCTDYNTGHLTWPANDFKGKYVYQHIVNTVGTELDIRTRQRLFIIQDKIDNINLTESTQISSGSLAEGLDLPGSDRDVMFVSNNVKVIRNELYIKHPIQCTTLVMETDTEHPGFSRLRLIARSVTCTEISSKCLEVTTEGSYVSVIGFVSRNKNEMSDIDLYLHGPCLSDIDQGIDIAFCLRSKCFPYQAIPWSFRHRNKWPPNNVIDNIIHYGCLLVPIGPRTLSNNRLLWRLSFSVAEKQLVHSFNYTQLVCYGLLKLMLKHVVNKNESIKDLLCSYFLKTALFWVSEEVDLDNFQLPKLSVCLFLCISKLISWVKHCYCPNYFIPEHNMFLGKITPANNEVLLQELHKIVSNGIEALLLQLFPPAGGICNRIGDNSGISFIKLEFLYYKICGFTDTIEKDIAGNCKVLTLLESLLRYESSPFIIQACKYQYAKTSQYVAQLLPSPTTTGETYNMHKCYISHLIKGTKTDVMSGWLLCASFYYVRRQYNVTLKLVKYALKRFKKYMVYLGCTDYSDKEIESYSQHVHNSVSLNDKIKIAVVDGVDYMKHSSLIPEELQLEVDCDANSLSPIVLSHCLTFLCYHHLGKIVKRQQALYKLHLTVVKRKFITESALSDSITILGVCFEILGDKDSAGICYDQALQCEEVCFSAEARK